MRMYYKEYGKQNRDVMIFLHGGGLSWWNYREVAELLQNDFRVIVPVLDGHGGSDKDFTTIERNAADVISLIDEKFGGSVLLIGGLSLGGQILLEMLSQREGICRYAMIESALVVPSKLTCSLIKPAFGSCYGLIRQKWFSKLQFQFLRIKKERFDDYYRDTSSISKQNLIAFLRENASYSIKKSLEACTASVHIYVGEKENKRMLRSAELIQEKLQGSRIHVLPDLHHGEFSMNHAERYVSELYAIVRQS